MFPLLVPPSQEAEFLNKLMLDLNVPSNSPIVLFEDNQSAICISKNAKNHPRTKHIDIKFHYIRDLIAANKVKLIYCSTEHMLADIFTKPLPADRFLKLVKLLGMTNIYSE